MAKKTAKKAKAKAKAKPAAKTGSSVKLSVPDKARTKTEIYNILAESAGISRKQVATMFDTLGDIVKKDLSKKGPGTVNVGGLMKVKVRERPAVKKGTMVRKPGTNEMVPAKPRPAQRVPKVTPLKALKDLI